MMFQEDMTENVLEGSSRSTPASPKASRAAPGPGAGAECVGVGGAAAGDLADHSQGRHPDWRGETGQGLQEEHRWSSSQNPLIFCTFEKTVRLPSGAPG